MQGQDQNYNRDYNDQGNFNNNQQNFNGNFNPQMNNGPAGNYNSGMTGNTQEFNGPKGERPQGRFTLNHEIFGGNLPVALCYLEPNQTLYAETGAMSWMSPNMKMETKTGGVGGAFTRMFTSESFFRNYYTPQGGPGLLAISSHFPGTIVSLELDGSRGYILQKSSFLAATMGVNQEAYFQKRLGAGFFGGEGFVLQRYTGHGTLLVEIDGSAWSTYLQAGQSIIIDTGYLAYMDDTCSMNIQQVPGLKNKFLGGEGWFNTVVTGPGNVVIQSHPLNQISKLFYSPGS